MADELEMEMELAIIRGIHTYIGNYIEKNGNTNGVSMQLEDIKSNIDKYMAYVNSPVMNKLHKAFLRAFGNVEDMHLG